MKVIYQQYLGECVHLYFCFTTSFHSLLCVGDCHPQKYGKEATLYLISFSCRPRALFEPWIIFGFLIINWKEKGQLGSRNIRILRITKVWE